MTEPAPGTETREGPHSSACALRSRAAGDPLVCTCGPSAPAPGEPGEGDVGHEFGTCAQWEARDWATVYERTAWMHDMGQHDGSDLPYAYCPRCEIEHPSGLLAAARAEAAGLRERLAAVEALCAEAMAWKGYDSRDTGHVALMDTVHDFIKDLRAAASPEVAPGTPPEPVECCASGRCEVCTPGYQW